MRLVKNCDLPKPPPAASASSLQAVNKFLHNQTSSLMASSSPAQKEAVSGQSMAYDISIKDSIVIGFMLGLWLYSIVLMFKAWSKILNFSDDQAGRPEKAAFLWKWLMEHIKNKKEGSSSNNSSRKASNSAMMMECSITGAAGEEVFIAKETTKEAAGGTKILQTATESTPLQQQTHSIDPQDNDVVVVHNDAEETALTKEERSSLHCGKSCIGEESYQVVSCCPIEHTASSTSTKTGNKRMLLQRQAKSLGQYDDFKAVALKTDLSLVHERLAVLETNPDVVTEELLANEAKPPALPPKDYFSYKEEML